MNEAERAMLHANDAAIRELAKILSLVIGNADLGLYDERKAVMLRLLDDVVERSTMLSTSASNDG